MEISAFSSLPPNLLAQPIQSKPIHKQTQADALTSNSETWLADQPLFKTAAAEAALPQLKFSHSNPLRMRELSQLSKQLERSIQTPGEWQRAAEQALNQHDTIQLNALVSLAGKRPELRGSGWLHYREASQRLGTVSSLPLSLMTRSTAAQIYRLVDQGLKAGGLNSIEQQFVIEQAAVSARHLKDPTLLLDLGLQASAKGLPNALKLQQEAITLAYSQAPSEVILEMAAKLPPSASETRLLVQKAQLEMIRQQDATGLRLLSQQYPQEKQYFQSALNTARQSRNGFELAMLVKQAPANEKVNIFQAAVQQARQSQDPALLLTLIDIQIDQALTIENSNDTADALFVYAVDIARNRQDSDMLIQLLERQTRPGGSIQPDNGNYKPERVLEYAANAARGKDSQPLLQLVSLLSERNINISNSNYKPENLYKEGISALQSKPDTDALLDWALLGQTHPELSQQSGVYPPSQLLQQALNQARFQKSPELLAQIAEQGSQSQLLTQLGVDPGILLSEAVLMAQQEADSLAEIAATAVVLNPEPQGLAHPHHLIRTLARVANNSPEKQLQVIALTENLKSPAPDLQARQLTRDLLRKTGLL